MIKLDNIERSYETKAGRSWVLRQVTLDIPAGDFVTIMGPSGAGKSTLLNVLGMFDGEFGGGRHLARIETCLIITQHNTLSELCRQSRRPTVHYLLPRIAPRFAPKGWTDCRTDRSHGCAADYRQPHGAGTHSDSKHRSGIRQRRRSHDGCGFELCRLHAGTHCKFSRDPVRPA
jgi:hypothetical protein